VKYTILAGEMALETHALEDALAYFERGLIAKGVDLESHSPAPDAEAAALLFGLSRAQAATLGRQQLHVALGRYSRAFEYYAATDDIARAVKVVGYSMQHIPGHRIALDFISRALALVSPESPEAGPLLCGYVFVLGLEEGDYRGPPKRSMPLWPSLGAREMWRLRCWPWRVHLMWTTGILRGSVLSKRG